MSVGRLALPQSLAERLRGARRVTVLTGAGMSAECGVPVFRGPGGLWEGSRPEDLATPEAFAEDPERVWRWYRWRLERVSEAVPHAGHHALVRLERAWSTGRVSVITQNVDGMHQRAGSWNVLELHGAITRARCSARCGRTAPAVTIDPADSGCPCGRGRLRPDVVWFGEGLDPGTLRDATEILTASDQVWVVGTSSVVYPAALLPDLAARNGSTVVEVNPEATPLSAHASFSLRVPASAGVESLVRVLLDRAS